MWLWLGVVLLLGIQQLVGSTNGQIHTEDEGGVVGGLVEEDEDTRLERSLLTPQTSFPTGEHTAQPTSTDLQSTQKEKGGGGVIETLISIPSGDYTQQPTSTHQPTSIFQPTVIPVIVNDSLMQIKVDFYGGIQPNIDKILSPNTGNEENIDTPIPTVAPTVVPTIAPTTTPTPYPAKAPIGGKHSPQNAAVVPAKKGVDKGKSTNKEKSPSDGKKVGDKKNSEKIPVASGSLVPPKSPDKEKNKDKGKDIKGAPKSGDKKHAPSLTEDKKKQGSIAPLLGKSAGEGKHRKPPPPLPPPLKFHPRSSFFINLLITLTCASPRTAGLPAIQRFAPGSLLLSSPQSYDSWSGGDPE